MDRLIQSDVAVAMLALFIFTIVRGFFYHAFYRMSYLTFVFVAPGTLYHFTTMWIVPGGDTILYAEYLIALSFLMVREMAGHRVHRYLYRALDLIAAGGLVLYGVSPASFTLFICVFSYTAAGKSWGTKPSYW